MKQQKGTIGLTIVVAALGYFVDIYDLQLFNMISKASLRGMGITDEAVVERYDYILFLWQMSGMLVGGLLWGIMGDMRGRKSVLFGSILLYSIANIANAFVINVEQYSLVRFIAGLGLAGELGAAITLVSELMDKEKRGYGTMIIVAAGALGAVAGAVISRMHWDILNLQGWQQAYIIGGLLGLMLLFLRMGTFESELFHARANVESGRGKISLLFNNRQRFIRYLACIAIGLPVWYCIGILIKFSERFAAVNAVHGGSVQVISAIMFAYIGLSFGDLLSGILSQLLRSRKKVVVGYLLLTVLVSVAVLYLQNISINMFYFLCFMLGTGSGYWALFVSIAAEQFGTNIRATVTTTVPNFVRGAVVPIVLLYKWMESFMGNINSAAIVGVICIALALVSILSLRESFGRDLNFVEK